jgi:sulfite exporter TauE/SafE/plastocyanin domain-containing protein/copper chaperone CopZ
MSKRRETFYVDGMTCSACEARISRSLLAIEGVSGAEARVQGGRVEVEFDDSLTGLEALKAEVEKAGYAVRKRKGASTTIALGLGLILAAAYLVAGSSGLFSALPKVDASIGYAMLFVVGLLTSIHCVAMCGGIALSQSVGRLEAAAAPPAGSRLRQLRPALLYNGGRVLSYTAIGGIVGALGAAFSFSPAVKGIIAGIAGLFMLVLGLKMIGIVRKFPSLTSLLPGRLRDAAAAFASGFRGRGPFAVGVLNGLMPCGPLQTMQLYSLGTGSAATGALSMFIFSAGTVPLMLLFGMTATLLPRKLVPIMVKASAVLVMFLGLVTFARAASLAGLALPDLPSMGRSAYAANPAKAGPPVLAVSDASGPASQGGIIKAVIANGVQTVTTEFKDGYYVPFVVQAGIPVRWTIRVTADELNGCNNPVTIPSYGIRKELVPGDNLVEFTPAKAGAIGYTCWMGMIRSKITVVSDLAAPGSGQPSTAELLAEGLGAQPAGGSCCSGATNPAFAGGKIPVESIGMPVIKDGVQEITITVGAQGYSPAAIILQKGMKAVIRFKAESLTSCNNPVVFPEYNGALDLSKGQLETPAIPVTADFTFQCWMGMIHGYAKAVDDLSKVDIEKIRAELGGYRAAGGAGGAGGAGASCCAASPKKEQL